MSDLNIGVAHISIEPMASSFQAQAEQKIKQALAPIRPAVNIQANLSQASIQKAITQVEAELKALSSGNNVVINGNIGPLQAKLAALAAQVAAVNSEMAKGGTGGFLGQANIAAATNELGKMGDRLQQVKQDLTDGGSTGTAAFMAISAAIASAEQRLSELKFNGVINADDVQQVTNLDKGLRTLEGTVKDAGDATSSAGGQARGLFAAFAKIAAVSIPLFAKSMDDVSGSVIPGFGDVLMEALPHMLSYASGVHMMLEAVVEFTAVWAPALVAIAAFALAAAPEAYKVYQQLDSMNTVAKATGTTFADFPKLTGALTSALKPQLLELYGIALQGVNSSSGKLGPALDVVAKGVDNVAAKIVAWTQNSSGGLEKFIESGAQDAGLLADAFVQLGRTLGTILQSVPGYAKMLLEFGDACLTVLADVVKFIQPAIALFLKLHGAIFYLGIATTLVASFGTAFLSAMVAVATGSVIETTTGKFAAMGSALGSLVGKFAATGAAAITYGQALVVLQGEEGTAAVASKVFADGMEAIPFGPLGLAVAVFAGVVGYGLYTAFTNSATAAQKFNAQMQNMVAQSNYLSLQQDIQAAIASTASKLGTVTNAYSTLTGNLNANTKSAHSNASAYGGQAQELTAMRAAASQLSDGLGKLISQSAITSIRQGDLATSYGGTSQAMELMNLAGVKASTLATDSGSQYALLKIQLSGVAQGYGLMTQQAGAAGAELDTINISTSAAIKAVGTLTSAETAWMTLVTGGVSSLSAFETGLSGLTTSQSTATKTAGAAGTTFKTTTTTTAGLAKVTYHSVAATLAQQAAFATQIGTATTYLGSLQTLSAAMGNTKTSQNLLMQAVKGTIAQMLPFAKGSATNTAELSSLSQLVGGPATDNFQTLAKWVGNTKDAENTALTATDKLTIGTSNLTTAAKNLAGAMSQDITQGQAAAVMNNGLQTATNNMYKAMQSSNDTMSTSVKLTGVDYYNALVKAGVGTTNATQYVDAFMKQQGYLQGPIDTMNALLDTQATKMDNIKNSAKNAQTALHNYATGGPYNAVVNTTVGADGTVQVKGAGPGLNDVLAHISFHGQGMAAGGIVPGGSAGGDNQLAMVKSGELIIPSQHAPKFADMARTAGIAGFSAGGLVGSAGLGAALSSVNNTDQQGMQAGSQQVMAQAVKDMTTYAKGQMTAASSANQKYNVSAGAKQWTADALKALAMNGLPASLLGQVLTQITSESGGNPNAINLTDSNAAAGDPSRGLLQTIASTFGEYHIAGTSENIYDPLANLAAAINYAKHVYGPSLINQYGNGLGSGHGYSAGGVTPEGIMGRGVTSGLPYSIGSGEYVGPLMGNSVNAMGMGSTMPGLTQIQGMKLINLLTQQNKILQGSPTQYAQGLNGAVGQGVQKAYYGT